MSSFHYDFILSKRSTLAKVWLAAHWEKKLSKVQVFETNLQSSVHDILNPVTPIALRTSSHLLVGLVRILSRKAKYLLTDCSETLVNIKVAFRPGIQTLEKPKKRKRNQDASDCALFITEKVDLLDQWVPEVSQVEMDCSLNQSRIEEITLQEEPMKVDSLIHDGYFDDEGFGDVPTELDDLEEGFSKDAADSVFPRVYSFADSGCGTEENFSSDPINDFSDPFTITPIKESLRENTESDLLEKRFNELPALTFESDDEISFTTPTVKRWTLEPCLEIPLLQNITSRNIASFTLEPVQRRTPLKQRKSLKRKLLVDQEISIERGEYFDQLNDTSTLISKPAFAPRSKRRMETITSDTVQSMFLFSSLRESVPPCLKNMCEYSNKKSALRKDSIFGTNSLEDNDTMSLFMPLRDMEYSSDEEEMPTLNYPGSSPLGFNSEGLNSPGVNLPEVGSSRFELPGSDPPGSDPPGSNSPGKNYPGCLTSSLVEEGCPSLDVVDSTLEFDQEADMSHDVFCAFVEEVVSAAQPNPVTFTNIICKDVSKTRKNVARKFLKCLLMQRDARLHLEQDSYCTEIHLYSGTTHTRQGITA